MDQIKKIKELIKKYPKLSILGYQVFKKYNYIKAELISYDYPKNSKKPDISIEKVKEYNKHRIAGPKKRICYAPFNNMHFTLNGKVSACSFNFSHFIGDINKQSIREIWFGRDAEEFRDELASYSFKKCLNCKYAFYSGNYPAFPPTKYDFYSSDETKYPTQMSFEISNLCNLECTMCNGNFSSLIRKNRENLSPIAYKYPTNFANQLEEFIPHLKIATFIGGEPLLIKAYYEIWDKILKINPKCAIHIQTNATVLPDKFKDILEIGNFEIGISIDAFEKDIFEKIRINANRDEVYNNIDFLINTKNNGIHLNFNYCLMINNWRELPKLINFANSKETILKIIHVTRPYYLSIRNYNSKLIQNIIDQLSTIVFDKNDTINTKRNYENYQYVLKELAFDLKLAKEREIYIASKIKESLSNLKEEHNHKVATLNFLSKCDSNDIQNLINKCNEFVTTITNDETIQKLIYIYHTHNINKHLDENNVLQTDLEDMFNVFKEMTEGILYIINEEKDI